MTPKELKQQAHKEFDDLFLTKSKCCNADVRKLLGRENNDLYCKTCGRFCKEIEKTKADDIKSFIDSLIDHTIQATEERIVKKVKGSITLYPTNYKGNPFMIPIGWSDELENNVISLITNKSNTNTKK